MTTVRTGFLASRELVDFLKNYALLIERQLGSVNSEMAAAVARIMDGINHVSGIDERYKNEAEQALVATSMTPDTVTRAAMTAAQDAIDDVFAAAMAEAQGAAPVAAKRDDKRDVRTKGGKFSKSIEALSGVSGNLVQSLMTIMGTLSMEDVIAQKLAHISNTVHTLALELGHLLIDFDSRFTQGHIKTFESTMKAFAQKQYSSVAEQKIFDTLFGGPQPAALPDENRETAEFLAFLHKFTLLMKLQMQAVKAEITASLGGAMSGIMDINGAVEKKKAHANAIFVKDNDGSGKFTVGSADAAASLTDDSALNSAPVMLIKMDAEVTAHVIKMMGELSIEDVVAQRLDHVIAAFQAGEKLIDYIVVNLKNRMTVDDVRTLTTSLLEQLWRQYTMESEKDAFIAVFSYRLPKTFGGRKIA